MALLKNREAVAERKADNHLKLALGGAALVALRNEQVARTFKHFLLTNAASGIEKEGLGRDRYDALLTAFKASSSHAEAA
jgi:hypothetical protein